MEEIVYTNSPVGTLQLTIDGEALTKLSITTGNHEKPKNPSDKAKEIIKQLGEYFEGKRKSFDVKIDLKGTDFQQRVWDELTRIPYGETISYAELASRVGNAKAQRAVGNANGKNPVCLIVPCHRVIQSDGKIGGYAYGPSVKQNLLDLEKKFKE